MPAAFADEMEGCSVCTGIVKRVVLVSTTQSAFLPADPVFGGAVAVRPASRYGLRETLAARSLCTMA